MALRPPPKPTHLEPSPLGTKEYWDTLYTTELSNNAADPSDVGTIWFDDSSAEDKILAFLHSRSLGLDPKRTSFLDLGTGNGHFLFKLREPWRGEEDEDEDEDEDEEEEAGETAEGDEDEDENIGVAQREGKNSKTIAKALTETNKSAKGQRFQGRILGTDYSRHSIEFAQRLAAANGYGPAAPPAVNPLEIALQHFDILRSPASAVLEGPNALGWDVVLDKGTFDAVSLSDEVDARGRKVCEGYGESILPLVRPGGLFLVTSCNWTAEEIRGWFEGRADGVGMLVFVAEVPYRSFSFGGRKGQTISSVCFRKVRDD